MELARTPRVSTANSCVAGWLLAGFCLLGMGCAGPQSTTDPKLRFFDVLLPAEEGGGLATSDGKRIFFGSFRPASVRRDRVSSLDIESGRVTELFADADNAGSALRVSQLIYDSRCLYWVEVFTTKDNKVLQSRIYRLDLASNEIKLLLATGQQTGSLFVPIISVDGDLMAYDTESDIYERLITDINSNVVVVRLSDMSEIYRSSPDSGLDISPSIRGTFLSFLHITDRETSIRVYNMTSRSVAEYKGRGISVLSTPTLYDSSLVFWNSESRRIEARDKESLAGRVLGGLDLSPFKLEQPIMGRSAVYIEASEQGGVPVSPTPFNRVVILDPNKLTYSSVLLPKELARVEDGLATGVGVIFVGNRTNSTNNTDTTYLAGFFNN